MKLGVLTGGGDCPGLNATIRSIYKAATFFQDELLGIENGFMGLVEGQMHLLSAAEIHPILTQGGTILGTSHRNPLKIEGAVEKACDFFKSQNFDALIVIGGDGTIEIAAEFSRRGIPLVCIPKTIDNDVWGTEFSLGFQTAVQTVTEAIDRLRTTADSHRRTMLVEVMGRDAGWIAAYAGIAGGADAILIPETAFPIEVLSDLVLQKEKGIKRSLIFVVSESARISLEDQTELAVPFTITKDGEKRLGGMAEQLALALEKRGIKDLRVTVLGHLQRGGSPIAFDRVLASRFGNQAVRAVHGHNFGSVMTLEAEEIRIKPIFEIAGKKRLLEASIVKSVSIR